MFIANTLFASCCVAHSIPFDYKRIVWITQYDADIPILNPLIHIPFQWSHFCFQIMEIIHHDLSEPNILYQKISEKLFQFLFWYLTVSWRFQDWYDREKMHKIVQQSINTTSKNRRESSLWCIREQLFEVFDV